MKNKKLHFITIGVLLVFILLGVGSTATVPINLGERYQRMVQSQTSDERVIDKITMNGNSNVCRDGNHSVSTQRMGAAYNVSERRGSERHWQESMLDQLLAEAQRKHPGVSVSLRNATIVGNRHVNARYEQYTESVAAGKNSAGKTVYQNVTRTRPIWDCFFVYTADVIINEPNLIEMSESYRDMIQAPKSNERIIDSVRTSETISGQTVSPPRMGAPYRVSEDRSSERHRHELILDRLAEDAKSRFPNVTVNIRNARIESNNHPNIFYIASVVTTQAMPETVTYNANLAVAGVTRADLYRRVDNYFDDRRFNEANSLGVRISRRDFDVGRIRGEYFYAIPSMGSYIIISEFAIDVHDARAEIRFTDTKMQRARDSSVEPIFLQSIAEAARAELVNFSNNLRSYINTRR